MKEMSKKHPDERRWNGILQLCVAHGVVTHPEHLFAQCSHYCELVSHPEQMPRVLEIAMQTAISRRGVAVIAMPGDIGFRDAFEEHPRLHYPGA